MINRISTRQKVKDLKTKMSNLELEVRALISGAEFEPGIIDAIHQDISEFTDEIKNIKKELENIKNSKNLKEDHLDLMNVYENMVDEISLGGDSTGFGIPSSIIGYNKGPLKSFTISTTNKEGKTQSNTINIPENGGIDDIEIILDGYKIITSINKA